METKEKMNNSEIQIRDPFIFVNWIDKKYYMYGSTDKNIWGKGTGFDVYIGEDLENWKGPFPVFRPTGYFFSEENFWAPEIYVYKGSYYMFATFLRKDNKHRGTAILRSDSLLGPFRQHSAEPVTPREWDSLDGSLYIDEENKPWLVFCHEWVQVGDGEICAVRLTEDLKEAVGEPELLFRASNAKWPTIFTGHQMKLETENNYVTDGPFIYKTHKGELLMLWASFLNNIYAQGISRSTTGSILGPWKHEEIPLCHNDGGHGMLFDTFEGNLMLTLHVPNLTPDERPVFIPVIEEAGGLVTCKSL